MSQFSTKEHDSKDGNMAQLVHPFPFILNELPCNLVQILIFQILLTLVIFPIGCFSEMSEQWIHAVEPPTDFSCICEGFGSFCDSHT